jgi:hypothetical protein
MMLLIVKGEHRLSVIIRSIILKYQTAWISTFESMRYFKRSIVIFLVLNQLDISLCLHISRVMLKVLSESVLIKHVP